MNPYRILCMVLASLLISNCNHDEPGTRSDFSQYMALSLEERQKPEHAVKAFEVGEGLEVQLFAAEPMAVNPTNLAIDEKGRIWICESYNYAVPKEKQTETGGRITILTDTDGDGRADERTVFYQGEDVSTALGISVFGDRVFVARSPNLLVFTDEDQDDRPDKKEVFFTGMGGPGDHSAHAVVFGPDGRFYFNYGNAGIKVLSPEGDTIRDLSGLAVRSDGHPYHGGMVFRFDADGSNFEVLGHNFRNNYEVAVDAYGTLWQSDNDDDGNQGVRINYVMEYGNFGYLDEFTGAHWTAPRTGMHEQIPVRHWHQNDPGVVPNLWYTGAGSPAGITVYEGDLLPPAFRGQVIHADAGPSVVRAYPVEADGAGFKASEKDIVRSIKDQWFRPVDVATAPDGSLFIADWYDPIVGGGAAGDHEKGRIFRVAPKGTSYNIQPADFEDYRKAADALNSPNEAVRYRAWQRLYAAGDAGMEALMARWTTGDSRSRARALWLLGQLPGGAAFAKEAAGDEDAQIRVVAIRLARQLDMDLISFLKPMTNDTSAAVRREIAIALRNENSLEGAEIWTELANKHDGVDRWYLEALGIGAERHWGLYFDTWLTSVGDNWDSPAGRDLVWRSRAKAAIPLLAKLIAHPQTDAKERLRYFRAFDFHTHPSKNDALLSLLETTHADRDQILSLALQHLDADGIVMTSNIRSALDHTLDHVKGTWQFVDLVQKFNLVDKRNDLLNLAISSSEEEVAANAARLLATSSAFDGISLIEAHIRKDPEGGQALLYTMQGIGSKPVLQLMQRVVLDDQLKMDVRKTAVQAMGKSWWGEDHLLEVVQRDQFPEQLKPQAASILFSVYRTSLHEQAEAYLERPGSIDREDLPPIRVLIATEGNVQRGRQVFDQYCQACHVVDGQGIDFGPNLSLIGDKLSREGLYRAIIYPSEGINYNYETYQLDLKSGGVAVGLLASETDNQVDLKLVGGSVQSYPKADIAKKEMLPQSLMTNLSLTMSQEALIDLVSYLATLKDAGSLTKTD